MVAKEVTAMTNIDTKIQHEFVQNAQLNPGQNVNKQHEEKADVKSYDVEDGGAVLNDVGKEIVLEDVAEADAVESTSEELKFKIVQEYSETLRSTANVEPQVVTQLLIGVA